MRELKAAILGGMVGALVVLVTGLGNPKAASASYRVPEIIQEYAKAQALVSGGGCSAASACSASSFTTTGTSTAATFTGTAGSGSNAFEVSTNGARVDFGAGANDHCSSDGTTVTCSSSWSWGNSQINAGSVRRAADSLALSMQGLTTNSDGTVLNVEARRVTSTTATTAQTFGVMNASVRVLGVFSKSGAVQMLGDTNANKPTCNSSATGTASATKGTLFFESDTSDLFFCDGTSWINLTP